MVAGSIEALPAILLNRKNFDSLEMNPSLHDGTLSRTPWRSHPLALLLLILFLIPLRASGQDIVYTDAARFPVFGKATQGTSYRYGRLPASYKERIRPALWELGENSAGLYIRFRTDAPSVHVRFVSKPGAGMPHMTDVGDNGVDLYASIDGNWRFVGSGFTWSRGRRKEKMLVGNMQPRMREYMMYLSLYDGVDSLRIGVPEGYGIYEPLLSSPATDHPVVMYGTSILQGGCASRPGMAHTAIISRELDREVINLGFSGNARLDMEIAELIAGVEDPGAVVLDYVPNSGPQLIRDRAVEFYSIIRKAHPDVPVIFVEDPIFPHSIVDLKMKEEIEGKNAAQKEVFRTLIERGEKNIYYVPAEGMIGDDGEATVDGVHLTDLGMVRYVHHLLPTLRGAMRNSGKL